MGYTHYFPQVDAPTEEQWNLFTKIIKTSFVKLNPDYIADGMGDTQIANDNDLFKHYDDLGEALSFNGLGESGHETCFIPKFRDTEFNFCKTNSKPYDNFVMITIIVLWYIMPNCFDISSDGESGDWKNGIDWVRDNIDYINVDDFIKDCL